MTSICYVTAYLELDRKNWSTFSRTFEEYLQSFLPLVKLFRNNDTTDCQLYIYIDDQCYNQLIEYIPDIQSLPITVIQINNSFLLKNMPLWIRLDRETEIINSVEHKKLIGHRLSSPETHNSKYTMINHLKVDFVAHTINMTTSTHLCWVDFGYFKDKNKIPLKLLNFNNFHKTKINYSLINELDDNDKDIYYNLSLAPEKIAGSFFFGSRQILMQYQQIYHEMHLYLQNINVVDDDQHIALLCYFKYPDIFKLHHHGQWHLDFKKFEKS